MDVLLRVGHLQKQKLRDDDAGNCVVHRRAEENDAVHEQAGINIPRPLAASGLLDHDGNQKILGVVHGNITTPFACKVKARSFNHGWTRMDTDLKSLSISAPKAPLKIA